MPAVRQKFHLAPCADFRDRLYEIAALDQLHNSTAAIFDLYGEKRTKILEKFGAVMTGNMGTTGLTQEQKQWLDPRAAELDGLIEVMLQRSEEDGQRAWDALMHLRDMLEARLGIKHKLERVNQG